MAGQRRASGTGQIKQTAAGTWAAKAVGGAHLGTFPTKREAQAALAESINNGNRAPRTAQGTAMQRTKAIGRYLDALANGEAGASRSISLGALAGFPNFTSDPEVIDQAVEAIKARTDEGGAIQRLKRQQRIIELQRAAEWLRESAVADVDNPETYFIDHGKAWAEDAGIGYSAFRAMGVPAQVLTRAGITRGFEP